MESLARVAGQSRRALAFVPWSLGALEATETAAEAVRLYLSVHLSLYVYIYIYAHMYAYVYTSLSLYIHIYIYRERENTRERERERECDKAGVCLREADRRRGDRDGLMQYNNLTECDMMGSNILLEYDIM